VESLALTFSSGWASGVNAYLVVLVLGLADRFGDAEQIPDALGRWEVLAAAAFMYAMEFVADKIPYVDTAWDGIHTFIRPPAAAFLSYTAFTGEGFPEEWKLAAALLAGSVALTSHGAKASTRAAVNVTPEPVSNWTLSVLEDGLVVFLTWMAAQHPLLTACLVVVLVIVAVFVIWQLYAFLRAAVQLLRKKLSPASP